MIRPHEFIRIAQYYLTNCVLRFEDLYRGLIMTVISSRGMRLAGSRTRMGKIRNSYGVSLEKPEGRKPTGRHRCRWEYCCELGNVHIA
jgi:hypothetical protein